MSRDSALALGIALAALGFVELRLVAPTSLCSWLGLLTLTIYILAYTPLKSRSSICTTIGAFPGAIPPLIGYAAASGRLDWRALTLFLILFIWQFPHFYSIAWMYRDDYARGGIQMLPVVKPEGSVTARRIVCFSILLIPTSLLPSLLGMTGLIYPVIAGAAGLGFLYFGTHLCGQQTFSRARRVVLASVLYLPLLLASMVMDRRIV